MLKAIRSARVIIVSFFAALLLLFTTVTANAGTVLIMGGVAAGVLPDLIMTNLFNGAFRNDNRVNVTWPAQARPYTGDTGLTLGESINVGVSNLNTAIAQGLAQIGPKDTLTVVGLSAGSLVVDEVLRQLAANPNAPGKGQLTFVLAADSSRQATITGQQPNSTLGYTFQPPPQTKYNIIVITKEYDGNADFPDRIFNLTAVANALVGAVLLHDSTFFADISTVPSANIKTTTNSLGGTTSSYLIPTAQLPLVTLLPFLAPYEAALKTMVDAGYSRNDVPPVAATRSALLAPTTSALTASSTTPTEAGKAAVTSESTGVAKAAKPAVVDVPATEPEASGPLNKVTDGQPSISATGSEGTAAEVKVSEKLDVEAGGAANAAKEPKAAKPAKSGTGVGVLTKRQVSDKKETSSKGGSEAKQTAAAGGGKSAGTKTSDAKSAAGDSSPS